MHTLSLKSHSEVARLASPRSTIMPKDQKKRGRWEEKKRKRQEEVVDVNLKCQKLHTTEEESKIFMADANKEFQSTPEDSVKPGTLSFYGLLDEQEQEYFKQTDSILELSQFEDAKERDLLLANVYEEASGKELKIASSQSCSRLMERLIFHSTPDQLKAIFQKFNGQ